MIRHNEIIKRVSRYSLLGHDQFFQSSFLLLLYLLDYFNNLYKHQVKLEDAHCCKHELVLLSHLTNKKITFPEHGENTHLHFFWGLETHLRLEKRKVMLMLKKKLLIPSFLSPMTFHRIHPSWRKDTSPTIDER